MLASLFGNGKSRKGSGEGHKDSECVRDYFLFQIMILAALGCLLILLYSLRFWASGQFFSIFGLGILVAGAALLSGFLLFGFGKNRKGSSEGRNGPDEDHRDRDEGHSFLLQMKVLSAFGCFLILIYSLRFWASGQAPRIFGVGMLVAGAALLSGFLLGFIFAIPRVGDQKGRAATAQPQGAQAPVSGAPNDPVPFNANLVEISDWLTKIIVGVGLVELHSIKDKLGELSYYLAPGLLPAPSVEPLISGQAAGLAILIFYSTLGFLLGYVWTMIYFRYLVGEFQHLIDDLQQKNATLEQQKDVERRLRITATSMISAEASLSKNRLDEAMATIDKALDNDPQNGFPVITKARILKKQAVQKTPHDQDKLKQAIACVDQAMALLPDKDKGESLYNKACYQALLDVNGLKSEILENLKTAFNLNPDLRQAAKGDDDLASLRQDADFIKLTS
jgi:hypothetical protein